MKHDDKIGQGNGGLTSIFNFTQNLVNPRVFGVPWCDLIF